MVKPNTCKQKSCSKLAIKIFGKKTIKRALSLLLVYNVTLVSLSSQHLLVQSQQWKHRNNNWATFKANNKTPERLHWQKKVMMNSGTLLIVTLLVLMIGFWQLFHLIFYEKVYQKCPILATGIVLPTALDMFKYKKKASITSLDVFINNIVTRASKVSLLLLSYLNTYFLVGWRKVITIIPIKKHVHKSPFEYQKKILGIFFKSTRQLKLSIVKCSPSLTRF